MRLGKIAPFSDFPHFSRGAVTGSGWSDGAPDALGSYLPPVALLHPSRLTGAVRAPRLVVCRGGDVLGLD